MRGKDLLDVLGYADEDLIKKASVPVKRDPVRTVLFRYGTLTAVFALLVGTALIFPHFRQMKPPLPNDVTTEIKDADNTDTDTVTAVPDENTNDITETNAPDTDTDIEETDPPTTDTRQNETTDSADTTTPIEIPVIVPQAGSWMRFTVLGKAADYIKLSDKQISEVNYKDNPLMYIEDEHGVWMFWSIAEGGEWTVGDILNIYGIASSNDITELKSERNNASKRDNMTVTSRELIDEFYGIIKNSEITHLFEREDNPDLYGNSKYREDEHKISESKFNLYIDVITANGDVFPLILSPFADDLRNNDTFYRVEDGKGKRMFEILRGVTVDEYEEMVVRESESKPDNNTISEQIGKLHSIFPIDPENPNDYLYPDDFGGTYRGDDGFLHVNITIPISEASHYTSLVDPTVVRFHTVKFSYTYLKEAYNIIRPHMNEYGIMKIGVMKRDNSIEIKISSKENAQRLTDFLNSVSIEADCCNIIVAGDAAIIPQ